MATRLVLIRHGQSVDNASGRLSGWTDSDLTTVGYDQARLVGRHIFDRYQPTAIYSSSLRRARQTANPLAELARLDVRERHDLREMHFGAADGLTDAEISERLGDAWFQSRQDEDNTAFGWPGGESRHEFFQRVIRGMDEIVAAHDGETVAIFSHGGVLSSLLAHLHEGRATRWRKYLLHNSSVSELRSTDGRLDVVHWNSVDHLSVT